MARAPSACLRIASTVAAMKPARFQFFFAPQIGNEILENVAAAFGVVYFGMKFDSVAAPRWVLNRSDGIVGAACDVETFRQPDHVIAVAVPDFKSARQAAEQGRRVLLVDIKVRRTVLAGFCANHLPAQRVCQPLHPITDSEKRARRVQNFCVADGRVRVIDRTWAAGEDEPDRFERADFFERRGAWENRGEHLLLADAARDQLRVLSSEIEYDDTVAGTRSSLGVRGFLHATRRVWGYMWRCTCFGSHPLHLAAAPISNCSA